jgi:hypothetical protein
MSDPPCIVVSSRKGKQMAKYEITTVVQYVFEVEADDLDTAEKMGWDYEDYQHFAEVYSVEVAELEEEEEEDE